MPAKPGSRSCRRFLRFSVRGLLVVVLIVGGWLGRLVHSARIQREAVEAVENTGGTVYYDWQVSNNGSCYVSSCQPDDSKLRTPEWAVELIGVDYFGHATAGMFCGKPAAGQALAQFGRLPRLKWLILDESSIDDSDLAHLRGLDHLTQLDLPGTRVTDAGLAHITGLRSLRCLNLSYTRITDAGLVHLKSLTELGYLDLSGTRVSDAGLANLAGMSKLVVLKLARTQITDAGLRHLKGLTQTMQIWVNDTQVTDAGVRDQRLALPQRYFMDR